MEKIDLHIHSTYSDGSFSPTDVILMAKNANLKAIALTDHDTISGLESARNAAKQHNIEFINGVEMSTFYDEKELHVLGLFIDDKNKALTDNLDMIVENRKERTKTMIEKFSEHNIDISLEDLCILSKETVITRSHFAQALVRKGYAKDTNHAFTKFLSINSPFFVPVKSNSPKETFNLIHNAGGIAILAHPLLYKFTNSQLINVIEQLKLLGLDGLEGRYWANTISDDAFLSQLANRFNLCISGGSDFHGASKPLISVGTGRGNLFIPYLLLEKMKLIIQNRF